jgi:hypothetical protein
MSPQQRKDLEATEQLFRGFTYTGDPEDLWAWGMMIDVHAGFPLVVQFPLGHRHFQSERAGRLGTAE